MDAWQQMQDSLDELKRDGLLRHPQAIGSPCGRRVDVGDRQVVCMCSNDYLSLANHPAVKSAAIEAIERWGVGTGSSRLVCGTTVIHVELERRLAEFKHTEAALVTPSGWTANRVAICAMAGKGDLVFCDKLNHASIIDAARACGARVRTYSHCDPQRLGKLLDRHRSSGKRCLIVTDSLFSMDGDIAPLHELVDLKNRYEAQLLIDEAHAMGIFGAGGRGIAELLGVEDDIDAYVGTLSKAIGASGGFVAGRRVLIDTIFNGGRAYIYTTAPPAGLCAAAIASLDIIDGDSQRREELLAMSEGLRECLVDMQMDICGSQSQIIPIVIGSADEAVRVSRSLFSSGYFVVAIRPPTVKRGTSRLRVSLCSGHCLEDVEGLLEALARAIRGVR